MLVLSRKPYETIRIGHDIVVRICKIKGSVVRLGIEAPQDVFIMKGELPSCNETDSHEGRPQNKIPAELPGAG